METILTHKVVPIAGEPPRLIEDSRNAPGFVAGFSCSKLKLDSLFLQFISLPNTQDLVSSYRPFWGRKSWNNRSVSLSIHTHVNTPRRHLNSQLLRLLEEIKAGENVTLSDAVSNSSFLGKIAVGNVGQSSSSFHAGSTPPLSPRKSGPLTTVQSPTKPLRIASPHHATGHPSILKPSTYGSTPSEAFDVHLPPTATTVVPSFRRLLAERTGEFLAPFGERLPLLGLKTLLHDTYGLPTSLAYPLLEKLAPGSSDGTVPVASLRAWLDVMNFAAQNQACRAFDILRCDDRQHVVPEDLHPLLTGILASHPGLAFLHDTPEFQERYAETVAHRIFYSLNTTGSGRLSLRDMRRGDFLEALRELEAEDDVNRCTRYFSYEHFYVIYCKFWDLDTDHDFLLSRDDLLRYANHSLTYRIADRLFEGAARPLASGIPGRMGYVDFLWFILSEEDKTTNTALDYWFRACDINGDNYLTPDELRWFYEEQLGRMECLSQETVSFDDIWAQMQDMLAPEDPNVFSMRDLKRSRALAGTLFNVLFNLNKFLAFETRDPFTIRQEREDAAAGTSPWDSFARQEYLRLAVDEADGEEPMAWSGTDFDAATAGGL
jgi:serine/threonine-protein phosphatase 2A regulatory subunit B''